MPRTADQRKRNGTQTRSSSKAPYKPALRCSFCHKEKRQVAKLVAGPGVCICDACIGLCNRMLTGKPTAAFEGWTFLNDEEFLATLPASAAAVDAAEQALRNHVDGLRQRGMSWERIAAALGVTRQAAWARFSGQA